MTQGLYAWSREGACPACGAPIWSRLKRSPLNEARPLGEDAGFLDPEEPETRRTCVSKCPYSDAHQGAKA